MVYRKGQKAAAPGTDTLGIVLPMYKGLRSMGAL